MSFLVLIGSAWSPFNLSFCVSWNILFLRTFLCPPWWHWNWQLPKNKYGVPVNLIWFSRLLFSQHMKGNFDVDNRISNRDAEKNIWIKFWYIFNRKSSFLSSFASLLIGVNEEVEGTTLQKEKKRKKNNWSYCANEKYFP